MLVEVKTNGEAQFAELNAKLLDEQGEVRKWSLSGENGHAPLRIEFEERSYVLEKIDYLPADAGIDRVAIEAWINDFLKDELERKQSGFDESEDNESAEPQPYDPHKINIRSQNWSISHMFELIDQWEQVDLAPDFQRGFVWDYARRSQLIESLMLRIPVPAFYLSETEDGMYQVVDGLQRLTTITSFLRNEFPLKHLEYLSEQRGRYFKADPDKNREGIDGNYYRNILQTQITVNIIEAGSPPKVKYDVFRRVNTGGKPLNNQEIRNCLSEKHTRALINELAKGEAFRKATSGSVSTTRMQAQELVLRFIGFWHNRVLKHPEWGYRGNMTEYLDNAIDLLNRGKCAKTSAIKAAFLRSMENAAWLFGPYSFRKCLPEHLLPGARQQLINKSLFSSWSVVLSRFPVEQVQASVEEGAFAAVLAERLGDKDNTDYLTAVSYKTNDPPYVDIAFKNAEALLNEHLKQV